MARKSTDDKLIQDNPGLSAYELLKKGLSEKRYQELLDTEQAPPKVKEPEKLIPDIKPSNRAMPKLSAHIPVLTDQARVKSPAGKVTILDRKYADKFVRKNPNYKIID